MGLGYDGFDTGNNGIAGIDVHSGFGIRLGSRQGHDPLLNWHWVTCPVRIGFSHYLRKRPVSFLEYSVSPFPPLRSARSETILADIRLFPTH